MRYFFRSIIFGLCAMVLFTGCETKTVLTQGQTPAVINKYIQDNFKNYKTLQVVKDREGVIVTYKAILTDGLSLEFNRKGQIIEIDGEHGLPQNVVPVSIRDYVANNFPNEIITDWEGKPRRQKVGLDNGLELIFTGSGEFLRIDD